MDSLNHCDTENDKTEEKTSDTKTKTGMNQGAKDDIGVCVVIILITVLAVIVTVIKIILFDVTTYPELFGNSSSSKNHNSSIT